MARIFINLERRTPPANFRSFGARLAPTFNYFQTAACLFQEGVLDLLGVREVAASLLRDSAYSPERLANSLADVQRRGHIDPASAVKLRDYLRAEQLLPLDGRGQRRPLARAGAADLGAPARLVEWPPCHHALPHRLPGAGVGRSSGRVELTANDEIVVLVTVPSAEEGGRIAEAIVGERLAACVNIVGPIRSVYRWEGKIARDEEHLLIVKTTGARYVALEARLLELHPYDVPEVVALPIRAGSAAYLAWIRGETS